MSRRPIRCASNGCPDDDGIPAALSLPRIHAGIVPAGCRDCRFTLAVQKNDGSVLKVIVKRSERESIGPKGAFMDWNAGNGILYINPSRGTRGGRAQIRLPGIVSTFYTATDIHFPDGSPVQRAGITPDIQAERTTKKGVLAGGDEVLEAMIEH